EHTCMVAQALVVAAGDVTKFARSLATQLRRWLLALPAGTGLATLKACVRLCLGLGPERSGVFSAGNGPAMRSAILGVCYGHDLDTLCDLVRASTRITHTDPKAEFGALAVALAAHLAATGDAVSPHEYLGSLRVALGSAADEFLALVEQAVESVAAGQTTEAFAEQLGLDHGVTGYTYHTVPVALHAWLRHPRDYRSAVVAIIRCGGDTDSTAAIVGGIVGAVVGKEGIPPDWLDNVCEWPRSVRWMEKLGHRLTEVCSRGEAQRPLPLPFYQVFLRNIFFVLVVLAHGLRRLLPPY
ncbi:MAG: ADP-ribosylglycohydrolase family protein, partial [Armatimonadota bacterium]|nr:ADP-ribosylglycohydrolase family protein [Armatimonadota bacterium]